jgi:hypothetical protein
MPRGCRRVGPIGCAGTEAVQPGDRELDDVAEDAQARTVRRASLCDHGSDSALPEESTVLVVVVTAVGQEGIWSSAWSSYAARDGRDLGEERQKSSDVIAVSAGQRYRERDALAVGDDVALTARPCAIDRAGPAFGPRRAARPWEESITGTRASSRFLSGASLRCWSSAPACGAGPRRQLAVLVLQDALQQPLIITLHRHHASPPNFARTWKCWQARPAMNRPRAESPRAPRERRWAAGLQPA